MLRNINKLTWFMNLSHTLRFKQTREAIMHAEGLGQTQICALEINNFINYILKKAVLKDAWKHVRRRIGEIRNN